VSRTYPTEWGLEVRNKVSIHTLSDMREVLVFGPWIASQNGGGPKALRHCAHPGTKALCGGRELQGLPFRLIRLPSSLCRSCTGVVRTQILGLAREWKGMSDMYDRAITKRGRQVLEATTSRPFYVQQQNRVDTTSNPLECASTYVQLYGWGQFYPGADRKYKTILIY